MSLATIAVITGIVLAAGILEAQDVKAEETMIRSLIAGGKTSYTNDRVFWSGAYRNPVVGTQTSAATHPGEMEQRKNQRNSTRVQRIEVAASADMAWEFSFATVEYDMEAPKPEHVKFETGLLRVWKKEAGQWKVAAAFIRPLDSAFERPAQPPALP
jgi:ketosteroid isomerase-like protein